jgi:hypothetical protein
MTTTISTHHVQFFVGNDNTTLQAEHDTLDDLIQDFGVFTDDVDIIFEPLFIYFGDG